MIRKHAWIIPTFVALLMATVAAPAQSRSLLVEDTSILRGEAGSFSIVLEAEGDENAVSFSLQFDPAALQYVSYAKGADVPPSSLIFPNTGAAAEGVFACLIGLQPLETFPQGRLELLRIHIQTVPGEAMVAPVVFTSEPARLSVSSSSADPLAFSAQGGAITLQASPTATDSTPVPTPSPTPTAPSATPDLLQIQVADTTILAGQEGVVPILYHARGDEKAMGFSLGFDPDMLTNATIAGGADLPASAVVIPNNTQAGSGRVGITMYVSDGTMPAGVLEVARLTVTAAAAAQGQTVDVAVTGNPIPISISDAEAKLIVGTVAGGQVIIPAVATPTLTPTPTPGETPLPVVYTTDVTGSPYTSGSVFSVDVAVRENVLEPVRAYFLRITYDGDSATFLGAEAIAGELAADPETGPIQGAGLNTFVDIGTLGVTANNRLDVKLVRLNFLVLETVAEAYSIEVSENPENFPLVGMSFAPLPHLYDNALTMPIPRAPEPTPTVEPTPPTPLPTPTPTEYADPNGYYDIAYFHRGRNTPSLIDVSPEGIRVLPGSAPGDALRITLRRRQTERPPIRLIASDTGLRRIYTEAPVDYLMMDGPLNQLTTRDAHVGFIGVDQLGQVRMLARQADTVGAHIYVRQPFYVNNREAKGQIALVGVALHHLDALESSFRALVLQSKLYVNPLTRARELSLSGVEAQGLQVSAATAPIDAIPADSLRSAVAPGLRAKSIDVIRATGASLRGSAFITETRAVVTRGQEYALGGGVLVEAPGDIAVDYFFLLGPSVRIVLNGGSITAGNILASGRITHVVARDLRKRNQLPMGGYVGSSDFYSPEATFDLTVASGLDSALLGAVPNIDRIIGQQGVNAVFHAGADFDDLSWTVAPDFEGMVRQVSTRREKIVRGVITMRPDAPARFPQIVGPFYNEMLIVTE